jgi:hypothetical protein
LKIIYYSPHPTHDIVSEVGYSTHQRETIHAMRALGHTVFPVILGGTEKGEVDIYHKRITTPGSGKQALVKLLPKFLLNTLKDLLVIRHDRRAAARLKQAIQEIQPDLVYERNEYMQDKGTLLCRAMNQYHILEINAPVVEEMRAFEGPSLLHFLAWKKEKNKIRNTNKILVVSSALQEYVKNKFHSEAPILVVHQPGNSCSGCRIHTCAEIGHRLEWQNHFWFCGKYFSLPRSGQTYSGICTGGGAISGGQVVGSRRWKNAG